MILLIVWWHHIFLTFVSVVFVNSFDFYFISQIDFIRIASKNVQKHLKMLKIDDQVRTNLMKYKRISLKIHKLAEMMNERFGVSILIVTTCKLIHFVIDIYWVYVRIIHNNYDSAFIREYFAYFLRCSYMSLFRSIKNYSWIFIPFH